MATSVTARNRYHKPPTDADRALALRIYFTAYDGEILCDDLAKIITDDFAARIQPIRDTAAKLYELTAYDDIGAVEDEILNSVNRLVAELDKISDGRSK